ncbi:MAG: serine/threonine-protein phosphatase [Bacilli bacterium]|nr:serine/threonine-protein phosphatase [Bacilli bacterium]MBQ4255282.1 serine/threonine-protein phosphatase [Bacilli bacterium]
MPTNLKGSFASKTDIGRIRISNDDQAYACTNSDKEVFLIVCDGMGGANKGDYASRTAIELMKESFSKKGRLSPFFAKRWMSKALKRANGIIYKESLDNPTYEGMGTTCVCVLLLGDKMIVGNVGDSRAYAYDGKNLIRLTSDDTVGDYLARVKGLSEEEFASSEERHILTNAVGVFASCSSTVKILPYRKETIILCSDGLYNNVPESGIRSCLSTDDRVDEKISALIAEANGNGGSDNIGIALWECRSNG